MMSWTDGSSRLFNLRVGAVLRPESDYRNTWTAVLNQLRKWRPNTPGLGQLFDEAIAATNAADEQSAGLKAAIDQVRDTLPRDDAEAIERIRLLVERASKASAPTQESEVVAMHDRAFGYFRGIALRHRRPRSGNEGQ